MQITASELIETLLRHDPAKPVCFCDSPHGLEFFRVKDRGAVLQIEFSQQIYRDRQRRLVLEEFFEADADPKEHAVLVGDLARHLSAGQNGKKPVCFGMAAGVLEFTAVEDRGEWVSIEFEQRIFRASSGGGLVAEETLNGQLVRSEFPVLENRDPGGSKTGAFAAIKRAGSAAP